MNTKMRMAPSKLTQVAQALGLQLSHLNRQNSLEKEFWHENS
jgi:hypothetical protein